MNWWSIYLNIDIFIIINMKKPETNVLSNSSFQLSVSVIEKSLKIKVNPFKGGVLDLNTVLTA